MLKPDKTINVFYHCHCHCIPHYEVTIRPNDKNFMNSDIRHKMNVRDRYWNNTSKQI